MSPAVRTLVVWCPDWAVVAAGLSLDEPVAVMRANRVVACSPAARAEGITVGLRRRDAQARCPELVVLADDPAGAARAFEPVVAALEVLTPRLQVVHPGCVALPTRGPSRYHGGDQALAHLATNLVAKLPPPPPPTPDILPGTPQPPAGPSEAADTPTADTPPARTASPPAETPRPTVAAGTSVAADGSTADTRAAVAAGRTVGDSGAGAVGTSVGGIRDGAGVADGSTADTRAAGNASGLSGTGAADRTAGESRASGGSGGTTVVGRWAGAAGGSAGDSRGGAGAAGGSVAGRGASGEGGGTTVVGRRAGAADGLAGSRAGAADRTAGESGASGGSGGTAVGGRRVGVGDGLVGGIRVGVGVADGLFAATLAARRATATGESVLVVPPGESPAFLAPLPLRVLDQHGDLVDVFGRLGLRTLGDLAALPTGKVVGRFGTDGLIAQRLALGLDSHPPSTTPPPPDLQVSVELDPPAERVETAAFAARGLADELHRRLTRRGSACTLLAIGAESEHGEHHERIWRTDGSFGPAAIADRLRWQLDGWLNSTRRPTGGLTRLWLHPEEVVAAGGRQLSFAAGGSDAVFAAERARRATARVQALIGTAAVTVPERRGGRGPGERVALVTTDLTDLTQPRPAASPGWVEAPWPGTLPEPSPAIVRSEPVPVRLLDGEGVPVRVNGRGELSAHPATLVTSPRARPVAVTLWAGPWPCDERWWDTLGHRRRARLQVVTRKGAAHLLILESGRWSIEATYD